MFNKGDYIVYGTNGVCRVDDFMEVDEGDDSRVYYVLDPVRTQGSTIYSPVNNKRVLMRGIISKDEAERLIAEAGQIETVKLVDSRAQEQQYKDVLKGCDCEECLKLIKSIYKSIKEREAAGRKITAVDEKYMFLAKDSLFNELAIVLDMDVDELDETIMNEFEKSLSVAATV